MYIFIEQNALHISLLMRRYVIRTKNIFVHLIFLPVHGRANLSCTLVAIVQVNIFHSTFHYFAIHASHALTFYASKNKHRNTSFNLNLKFFLQMVAQGPHH